MTISEQFLPQILIALEQYGAYMHATNRDPEPYRAIADQLRQAQHRTSYTPKLKPSQPKAKSTTPLHLPPSEDWFIFRMRLDLSDL